ncbi:MAG: hypothetical protein Q8873_00885 [Bacillota bacterium]|nr:hypothetical protein [Bacillota bacterium]
MKKAFSLLLAVWAAMFALCSCTGPDGSEALYGTWKTDNIGYYTVTTFSANGEMHSVYRISDSKISSGYGLTQEILDSMETFGYYKVVKKSEMTPKQKKEAVGKSMIKTYTSKANMKADKDADTAYYKFDGKKLIINDSVYQKYEK